MIKVGLATLDEQLTSHLIQEGFRWSDERRCFFMETEKFRKWNNKPAANRSALIGVDNLARHTTYGDTGKTFSEILRH